MPTGEGVIRRVGAIVVVGLLSFGCGSGSKSSSSPGSKANLAPEQVLRINSFYQPPNFDPGQSPGPYGPNALIRQYTESLLRLRPDGKDVSSAAAESFNVSADQLTYTFRLRRDGRYNDNQPVKAPDFVFGWRRLLDPRLAAPLGSTLFAPFVKGGQEAVNMDAKAAGPTIEGALDQLGLAAPDDSTFVVTLARPAPEFKYVAALPAGAPVRKDVVDKFGSDTWSTKPESLITNGPFRLSAASPGQSVTLVQNPYYRSRPTITKILAIQLSGQDVGAAWTKYLNGEQDISNGPPEASYDSALKDPTLSKEVLKYPEPSTSYVEFNTTKPPFDNAQVRQAFAMALDRNALTRLGGAVSSKAIATLVPDGVPGTNPALSSIQAFDPVKAKALLDSSGVSKDRLNGLRLLVPGYYSQTGQFIQDQFKRNLGVNLSIDLNEDPTSLVTQGNYDVYVGGYYQASYPDPTPFYDLFLPGNPGNEPKWTNADYERLVRQADATPGMQDRLGLFRQAEEVLLRDAPIVPYAQTVRYFWIKPWVKGVNSSPFDDADLPGGLDIASIYIVKH